jgi:hypothetical protein
MYFLIELAISAGVGLAVGALVTALSGTRNARMLFSLLAGMVGALLGAGGLLLADPNMGHVAIVGLAAVFGAVGALLQEVVALMIQVQREPAQSKMPVYEAKTPNYKIEDLETTIIRIKKSREAMSG